jgi:dipeptidase
MDVFYYLKRGYEFEFIHRAMPSLTEEQFASVVEYVKEHYEELSAKDDRVEEFHQRGITAQHARGGMFSPSAENLTTEERVARLREKMTQKLAGKNGARNPR